MINKLYIYTYYFMVVCLINVGIFARGLYFELDMSIHHYAVAVFMFITVILLFLDQYRARHSSCKKDIQFNLSVLKGMLSPYYVSVLMLTVFYYVSFLLAVNSREAYFSWLRQLDYLLMFSIVLFAIYLSGSRVQASKFIDLILHTVVGTGTVVALLGLFDRWDILNIYGSLVNNRIGSVFQYPNTMAVYLGAVFVLTVYLIVTGCRSISTGAYAVCGFLMLLAIIGSQSRGVWFILPFVLLLLCLGPLPYKRTGLVLLGLFVIAITCESAAIPSGSQTQPDWQAFGLTLIGLGGSYIWGSKGINYNLLRNWNRAKGSSRKLIGLVTLLITTVFSVILVVGQNNFLLQRITSIQLDAGTLRERLMFVFDAWKMIVERPLYGWGGGGWISAYHVYQSYLYEAADLHNHYVQILLETGVLGFSAFLLSVFALIIGMVYLRRKRSVPMAGRSWAIGVALLFLALHSAMDFNFAFSSIDIFYWSLLAVFGYCEIEQNFGSSARIANLVLNFSFFKPMPNRISNISSGLSVILLVLLSFQLFAATLAVRIADSTAKNVIIEVSRGDLVSADKELSRVSFKLWDSADLVELAGVVSRLSTEGIKVTASFPDALELAKKGVVLDIYNADHRQKLAQLYLNRGDYTSANKEAEKAVSLQPWVIGKYEELLEIVLNGVIRQWRPVNLGSLQNTLRQSVRVVEEGLSREEALAPELKKLRNSRNSGLVLTPRLSLALGQAYTLLGDYHKATVVLGKAVKEGDENQRSYSLLWMGVALEKSGDARGKLILETVARQSSQMQQEEMALKSLLKI